MRALVTGGTGFVGRRLLKHLDRAVVLSRNAARAESELARFGVQAFAWDPAKESAPAKAFDGIDAVFHLAGDPVAEGRWTAEKKARLRESRIAGTQNLVKTLAGLPARPKVLVSASAVGFYGDRGDELVDESSAPGRGFLAEVCQQWEAETHAARDADVRVVNSRLGMILSPDGGALANMLTPFKLGFGGVIGSGRQYLSWITLDDAVRVIQFALVAAAVCGPVNVVAPEPVTNREFTKTLGRVLGRPTILPMPAVAARLAFGEMADEILLSGARVEPQALAAAGFKFQQPRLEPALRQMLGRA